MTITKQKKQRLQVRADGRIIISYPKSGRTWIRYALDQFNINVTFTHAGAATNRQQIGRPTPDIPPDYVELPLVFLYRNPIDTAVSMFYQIHKRDLRRGSGRWFRKFLPLALNGALPPRDIDRFVLHPRYGVPKICEFNQRWLNHLDGRDDCLILKYEDMRENPSSEFQRLISFFGVNYITGFELAEASSFERMKSVEQQGKHSLVLRASNPKDATSAKVRRGKVGGYHDELRPETISLCRQIAQDYGFG